MKPPVETVKVSQRGKEVLSRLKARTGIDQWNILCRWAICASLQSANRAPKLENLPDSNVEMNWKTFAGPISEVLPIVLAKRALNDGVDLADISAFSQFFREHLERGIAKIQTVKSVDDLLSWDRN
jgi:DNA sulfur modification protein DndE